VAPILGAWCWIDSATPDPQTSPNVELLAPIVPIPPVGPPDEDASVAQLPPPAEDGEEITQEDRLKESITLIPTKPPGR
jgi:hypothetical protein